MERNVAPQVYVNRLSTDISEFPVSCCRCCEMADDISQNPLKLIAKGILPVKEEFIKKIGSNRTATEAVGGEGKGAQAKSRRKQKKVIMAADRSTTSFGSLHLCALYDIACLHNTHAWSHVRSMDHPCAHGPQEQVAKRGNEMCSSWLQDKCHWGDKCRFSHDVEAFARAKPADLPGRCPFSSTGECSYGGYLMPCHTFGGL